MCVYAQFGCLSPRLAHTLTASPPDPIASPLTRLPLLSRHSLACVCHRPPLTGSLASSALIPDFQLCYAPLPAGNIENIRNIKNNNTCSADISALPPPPPPPPRLHHWPWPSSFGHIAATLWTVLPTPPSYREFIRATVTKPNRLPSRGFLHPTSLSHTTNSFPQDLTPDPEAERV